MGYTCARAGGRACVCVRVYVHACVCTSVRAFACVRMCVCARVQQAAFGVGGAYQFKNKLCPGVHEQQKGPWQPARHGSKSRETAHPLPRCTLS